MSNWPTVKFESLYLIQSRNGVNRPRRVRGSGYKMINMGELFEYGRIKNPPMELVPLDEEEIRKYGIKEGDLLFARQSLVESGAGKCSIALFVPETTTFEGHLIRVRLDQSKANPLFYYYYFSSSIGKGNIQSIVRMVAAAGIRGSELAQLQTPFPPLPIQRKIAAILSTYDDLIENNARRIEILEAMARAIYRAWFVEFRFPGHEDVGMVDSELGPIPEGWRIKRLDEVGKEIILGKTPSTKDPENFGQHMPFIKIPYMRGSLFNIQTDTYLSRKGAESQENKTLPPNTICVSCIGTVGLVTITTEPSQTNQQINSIVLKDQIWREYLFFALSDLKKIIQLHGATGATMPNLSKTKFSALKIVIPEETIISAFHNLTHPMFEQIKTLQFMNEKLRQTRDLLLPKLVSGAVEV